MTKRVIVLSFSGSSNDVQVFLKAPPPGDVLLPE